MISKNITSGLRAFPFVIIGLIISSFLLRIYESIILLSQQDIPLFLVLEASFRDLPFIGLISVCSLPFFILWHSIHKKSAIVSAYVFVGFFALIHILLLEYFFTAQNPLDQILFTYNVDELLFIISSSATTSYTLFVSIIIGILTFVITSTWFIAKTIWLHLRITHILLYAFIGIGCISIWFTSPERKDYDKEFYYFASLQKTQYFATAALKHFSQKTNQNNNIDEIAIEYQKGFPHRNYFSTQYPLAYEYSNNDVLGPYFNFTKQKPNIVFIIVESLGRSISGKNAAIASITPFLDSLSTHSLVWNNFMSNSERTFGVLGNIFGSLPYGEKGFTVLEPQMPKHQTLIKYVGNEYQTNFFYGGWSYFDKMSVFLKQNNIDYILEETGFDSTTFKKIDKRGASYSWGYHDADVFKRSFEIIAETNKEPRFDIYLTLSTHAPWAIVDKELYITKLLKHLKKQKVSKETYELVKKHIHESACFYYADNCIRNYFEQAKKQAWFSNTIFIITGDHRQEFFPRKSELEAYHVPFIIYSPMLKKPVAFESVSSHLDITPSLVSLLHTNFGLEKPQYVHWLGYGIDTSKIFRNAKTYCFMQTNRSITEIVDKQYAVIDNVLYSIHPNLQTKKVDNPNLQATLENKLELFKQVNSYVCKHNKLCLICK